MKKKYPPRINPRGNGDPKEKPDQEFQHETPHEHQTEEGIPGRHARMIPDEEQHPRRRFSEDSGRSL